MIIRIVQMTFEADKVSGFLKLFEERKEIIRNQEGCRHLELWQGENAENTFFTYSIWESEHYLNQYRFSAFFKDTWIHTKKLFSEKAQAWSVTPHTILK